MTELNNCAGLDCEFEIIQNKNEKDELLLNLTTENIEMKNN